jgi:hypothetical protein
VPAVGYYAGCWRGRTVGIEWGRGEAVLPLAWTIDNSRRPPLVSVATLDHVEKTMLTTLRNARLGDKWARSWFGVVVPCGKLNIYKYRYDCRTETWAGPCINACNKPSR